MGAGTMQSPCIYISYLLWIAMSKARDVRKHLLIRALVSFGQLNHPIKDKNFAVVHRIEHQDVLKVRSLMEQDLFHLQNTQTKPSRLLVFPMFHRIIYYVTRPRARYRS